MTKPIPDKAEVALEYPDKLYRASMPLGAPVMTDRRIRTLFAISLLCFAIPAQAQIAPVALSFSIRHFANDHNHGVRAAQIFTVG